MEGLEKDSKGDPSAQMDEATTNENEEGDLKVAQMGKDEKTTLQKKTFFEKFTEGLKDFLDNAE
jgi:cell division protein FtsA